MDFELEMLMARYQQGDSAAATALVERLSPVLHRFFLVQFVSRRYADDLLQETWLRIHGARQTYRVGEPLLPWLYAIARHIRLQTLPETTAPDDLEPILAQLPAPQREVVFMLKVAGMSREEVARATSSSVRSVKQKAHLAYDNLRKSEPPPPPPLAPDPALTRRAAAALVSTLDPVRPLAPAPVLVVGLLIIWGTAALVGAGALGMYGLRRLPAAQMLLILSTLSVLVWLAATLTVAAVTPGSRRPLSPALLVGWCALALTAIFALLFRDYRMDGFVYHGVACLQAGLLLALPAVLLIANLLRRGYAVNAATAGVAAGTVAGLAGVTMLALHCPILQASHVMVWHTAVVPLSALAAAALAAGIHVLVRKRSAAELMQ